MNKEEEFPSLHYAFKVSDEDFNKIFERIKANNIEFGSTPSSVVTDSYDNKINHNYGGKGVYFRDPNRHILEILTVDYDLDVDPTVS